MSHWDTWDIESINMSKKDKHFYEKFENNLCFDGERYCVRLSFTESFSQIPDNFSNSFFRLKNLKVKLQNNDELKENYCRVLNEYESQGIIKRLITLLNLVGYITSQIVL